MLPRAAAAEGARLRMLEDVCWQWANESGPGRARGRREG